MVARGFTNTIHEVIDMAKAGMRRPDPSEPHGTESNRKTHFPKNRTEPVPLIQGHAKHGEKARPIIMDGTRQPHKVFHELRGDGALESTRAN